MSTETVTPAALINWREEMNLSQRAAAAMLGCSRTAWFGWENGDNEVPLYIGLAMAARTAGIAPYGTKQSRRTVAL